MRALLGPVAALMLFSGIPAANAAIAITVNKDLQEMTVSVDGVPRYHWPISSGNPSHETPNGKFQAFRMEEDHDRLPVRRETAGKRQGRAGRHGDREGHGDPLYIIVEFGPRDPVHPTDIDIEGRDGGGWA